MVSQLIVLQKHQGFLAWLVDIANGDLLALNMGIVVSVDTKNKKATVIHTGNSLDGKNPNSWVDTYSYPATGVTFVYLGNYLK